MLQLSADELQQIRNTVHDKQVFLVVDESIPSGIWYLNMLVISPEKPHVNYLLDCQPLPCMPNSNSIARTIDDAVNSLEINNNFFLFCIV